MIFLPGVVEIKQCIEAVEKTVNQNGVVVLPLHANLSISEQQKVFKSTKSWKVIAATNVAEVCPGPSLRFCNHYQISRPLLLLTTLYMLLMRAKSRRHVMIQTQTCHAW